MATWGGMQWPAPFPPVAYHLSLQHERGYLLSALAREEEKAQRFSLSLESTRSKLRTAEKADDSIAVKNFKRAASGLSRKLKLCQRTQKSMGANLVAVNARLASAEQYQWRRLQYEYQQSQNIPPVLAMGMQNLNLQPQSSSAQQLYVQPYSRPQLMMELPPPMTPIQPQYAAYSPGDDPWGSPLYTPFYEQSAPFLPVPKQQLQEIPSDTVWTPESSWSLIDGAQGHNPFAVIHSNKNRAMSLPSKWPISKRSSERSSSLEEIGEVDENGFSLPTSVELCRRLSLVGGASAGLRLGKLASS